MDEKQLELRFPNCQARRGCLCGAPCRGAGLLSPHSGSVHPPFIPHAVLGEMMNYTVTPPSIPGPVGWVPADICVFHFPFRYVSRYRVPLQSIVFV